MLDERYTHATSGPIGGLVVGLVLQRYIHFVYTWSAIGLPLCPPIGFHVACTQDVLDMSSTFYDSNAQDAHVLTHNLRLPSVHTVLECY